IRTLRCPTAVVRRTLEATWLVLNAGKGASVAQAPPTWLRVQKMLLDTNLVGRMRDFDASALKAEPVLAAYIVSEYFSAGEKYQRSPARSSTSYQRLLISRPSSSSTGGSPVGAAAMVRTESISSTGGSLVGAATTLRTLRRATTLLAAGRQIVVDEPLTYQRVRRASVAAGALFGWCTVTLVEALDIQVSEDPAVQDQ
ncbi:unnamed protein product, partial [Polarella glacialis]